jgi:4-hydroxy-L-threonine phosphate dehydrogenase PdxA
MKAVKLFEQFITEGNEKAIQRLEALPPGKIFQDAKNIESVFKRSKHTWHEVIETFEAGQAEAEATQLQIKQIQITQPNIQLNKVKAMLQQRNLPPVPVVQFKDGFVIYDGHHRLLAAWAQNQAKISVLLVKA